MGLKVPPLRIRFFAQRDRACAMLCSAPICAFSFRQTPAGGNTMKDNDEEGEEEGYTPGTGKLTLLMIPQR